MKDTIRTFIAIKITPGQKLLELVARLKCAFDGEAIKWVETNNMHLTLRFFGETNRRQVLEIGRRIENIAYNFQPFQLNLNGVSYFKSKNQPRVLLLTIENNPILKQLVDEIEREVESLKFESENRNFKPHITLARIKFVKIRNAFFTLIDGLKENEIQTVEVSEIIFYESVLNSKGPEYKVIKTIKFK